MKFSKYNNPAKRARRAKMARIKNANAPSAERIEEAREQLYRDLASAPSDAIRSMMIDDFNKWAKKGY